MYLNFTKGTSTPPPILQNEKTWAHCRTSITILQNSMTQTRLSVMTSPGTRIFKDQQKALIKGWAAATHTPGKLLKSV